LAPRPRAYAPTLGGGGRASAAARRGKPLALEPVTVQVHEWRVVREALPELEVEVTCAGGTYIRALARDLGEACGSAAHLVALRRLRDGAFVVDDAQSLESLEAGAAIRPALAAVSHLPVQAVDPDEARRLAQGRDVDARVTGERVALVQDGGLRAGAVREGARQRPRVVMRDA
jgi:tRNA pseudouridine55 synthase